MKYASIINRFSEKYIVRLNGCWEWQGASYTNGYGVFHGTSAHRWSYEYHKGTIPKGMLVCHTCDNPPCVNPTHLFLGTTKDNARDRDEKGRGRATLTNETVLAIYHSNDSAKVLANRYSTTQRNVWGIKSGRTWSKVTKHEEENE